MISGLVFSHTRRTRPIAERFMEKVEKSDGCWIWKGFGMGNGYGGFHVGGRTVRKMVPAHRASYELHKGAIPEGMHVMHQCDVRRCVNPEHLKLGTRSDNMQDAARKGRVCTIGQSRKTHCVNGHELTPDNTYVNKFGHRRCHICRRAASRRRDRIAAAIRARGESNG